MEEQHVCSGHVASGEIPPLVVERVNVLAVRRPAASVGELREEGKPCPLVADDQSPLAKLAQCCLCIRDAEARGLGHHCGAAPEEAWQEQTRLWAGVEP
jgi:hypothetical protein